MKRKNSPAAAIKCLHDSDSFIDVNFVGDVCLKVRKAEVVLCEEFKTDVTALFLAVHNDNVALVRKLLSIEADENQKLFRGYSTTIVVRENHLETLEMLLKAGDSQQACEGALLEASYYGHARISELLMGSDLLKCGVDVNAISRVLLQSCKPSLHTNRYYKVEGVKYTFEPKTIRRMIQTERIFLFKTMTVSHLYAQNRVFIYRLIRLSALELVWKAVGTDLIKMMNPIAVNRYKRFPKAGLAAQIATGPLSAPVNMSAFEKKNNETILVFDLGGGTFDVSVLEVGDGVFEVLSTPRDIHLGDDVNVSVTTMTNNLSSPTSMLSFAAEVRKGNERVAKLFENDLEKVGADIDSDVNSRSYCGQTALMQACRFGHWKVVQILGGDDFDKRIGDWLASNFKEDEGIDLLELLLKLNGQQELLEFQSH